jgi:glycosyltransferase involved in cell wall biosynthesis
MGKDRTPKVSICIPAYNQTIYLKILLESISLQTFTDYEIIISDDSTTPDVKELIDTFHFPGKLKYFKNQPALGSPANWNAAIGKATGEYIKIMHHDDAFAGKISLEEMINCMESNGYDYVFSDSSVGNVKDPGQNRVHQIRGFNKLASKPYLLFFGNSIGGPSALLIKKKIAADLEYDPRFIWLVDIEYYIRLLGTHSKGGVISRPLIHTHDATDHRLTTTILKNFELQIKEQAMLYNYLFSKTPAVPGFFMQVYLVRLFFKAGTKNKELTGFFDNTPRLLKIYFCTIKFKPLYFAYNLLIKTSDIIRKILFR